jgi:hypothetical protein
MHEPYGFIAEIVFDPDEKDMWVPPGRVTAVVRLPDTSTESHK